MNSASIVAKVLPNCTLEGDGERAFRRALARHVGRTVVIPEIKRFRVKRTNQQCRAVMGLWMPIVLEELGYHRHDLERVYNWIKEQCWFEEKVSQSTGLVIKVARDTHEDNTEEYSKFMEAFRAFVEDRDSGLGIFLPDPNPDYARI